MTFYCHFKFQWIVFQILCTIIVCVYGVCHKRDKVFYWNFLFAWLLLVVFYLIYVSSIIQCILFAPMLLKAIENGLDPNMACSQIGLCSSGNFWSNIPFHALPYLKWSITSYPIHLIWLKMSSTFRNPHQFWWVCIQFFLQLLL